MKHASKHAAVVVSSWRTRFLLFLLTPTHVCYPNFETRTVEEAPPGACLQRAGQLDLIEGVDLAQLELVPTIELREALPIGTHVRHASALLVGGGRAYGQLGGPVRAGQTEGRGMTSCGLCRRGRGVSCACVQLSYRPQVLV